MGAEGLEDKVYIQKERIHEHHGVNDRSVLLALKS
jgi:hypothetical protein